MCGMIVSVAEATNPRASSGRSAMCRRFPVLLLGAVAAIAGCKSPPSATPAGVPIAIPAPLGLPPVPIPPENPPTAPSIALGRRLFYDTRLSKDDSLSCASCHRPENGFTDGQERSKGVGGMIGLRNAPTLIDVAYSPLYFWDGRAASLEAQVPGPIADPLEMNQTHKASVAKLKDDRSYAAMFRDAFGSGDITLERVENALASFERTILSGGSAFDEYEYGGRNDALTAAQIRGLEVFRNPAKGNCAACHAIGAHDALFTDGEFHNTGEGVDATGELTDLGRYRVTHIDADRGAFKTPTLRNVEMTAPYMHDGRLKTLNDVVDFYAGGGNSNPYLDNRMSEIKLSAQERSDLVEFMRSLTGKLPLGVGPPTEVKSQ